MSQHLALIAFIMVSFQAFAIDTQVPALHWILPTTLEGIRQQASKLKIEEEPMPVSIMCQSVHHEMPVQREAVGMTKPDRYWTVKRDMTLACVPYLTLGFALHAIKRDIRKVNTDINGGFRNRADDYIQYAPLLFTWGLKATGYEGRSQWGRLLTSNALSAIIMAGLVNSIKYSVAEVRPDGSTANSFPSGHTATAFMAATILHKEYGLTRSLWYSVGGYTVATSIGIFRVMNNRHWVSDVMMGAGIGILSTELGYALSDLIFKDKYTLRREMENLNDIREHPSFFSLQAGAGIMIGHYGIPNEIVAAGGPNSLKQGISSVIAAEAAYFLNPYLGFGLRARINSTAITPRWKGREEIWNSGVLHYNPTVNQYEHPNPYDASYRHSTSTHKDQLSSFDIMGGIYGQLPLNKRMSLGAKLLFGRRKLGHVWFFADKSGNDDDFEAYAENWADEMLSKKNDINTFDRIQGVNIDGKGSFIFGTGFCFSYALKHNIVWRVGLDYDFSHIRYEYDFLNISLVEEVNKMLSGATNATIQEGTTGSFRRSMHQLTPSFGICFSF